MRVEEWQKVYLGSLANFRNGLNYSKKNFGSGMKVINVKDFQDRSFPEFDALDEIDPEGIVKEEDLLKEGDILFVRSNGNRELIGRSLFVTNPPESVAHSAFTIKVRFDSPSVIPRFYAYLFRSLLIRQVLSAHGGGTNISNLNQGILNNLQVPLPPLPTQRKIASILSAYDDLIENNTRRIEILEEMARAIYREWFVHFRFPGHEKVGMVDSPLGEVPEGWEVVRLGELAELNASSIKKGSAPERIQYIDIASVSTGRIEKIDSLDFADAPSRARRIVEHGDVIWSTVRPNRKSYAIILAPPSDLIVSTGFAVITGKRAPYTYLYHALTTDDFANYLTNRATGSAYPAVNAGDFEQATILFPPSTLLESFHEIASDLLDQKQSLQAKNDNLRRTRDLLLPRLISGEVSVEDLEIETVESRV